MNSTESNSMNGSHLLGLENFSDEDFRRTIWSALRLIGLAVAIGLPLLWWKLGWASAALFGVGALISGSSLFEWLRLMTAVIARMDKAGEGSPPVRPLGSVLFIFFLRLAIAVLLLYGSLRFLHGSVFALIAGLALGILALSFEGIRLLKSWTV
ncbi:MAG: hypothetical protein P4K80_09105 [Acidobacteriaceae bacterium]|nr:hypothetical protein [Acidobacteriaceae bacterium]